MPTYVWRNKKTEEHVEVRCSMSDIDKYLESVDDPSVWERVPQMPNVRTEKLSTSFLDGVVPEDRKSHFRDIKEAAKLESQSYNLPPDKRAGINKEIKKLKETKK